MECAVDNTNIEVERGVLSAILYDPSLFDEIASIVDSNDFGYVPHKVIFSIMKLLDQEELPIEESFILKKSNKEHKVSKRELSSILATVPLAATKQYAQDIKDLSIKRQLRSLALRVMKESEDSSTEVQSLLDLLQSHIYELSYSRSNGDFKSAKDVVVAALEHLKKLKERGNSTITGLDTGFRDLNDLTTGLNNGDLVIIAARPGMGKTTLVLNMAYSVLQQDLGVAFFSLEMPAEQLMIRLFSSVVGIHLQDLRVGNLDDDELGRLSKVADSIAESSLFIDDNGGLTIQLLRTKLRRLKTDNPQISLAVVDYLQLMTGGSNNKDRYQEVSEISRGLKLIARELNIPIIALSQLNRTLENRSDKRPMLSDLRESGAIEQDADLILFIYRDWVYKVREEREKEKEKKKGKENYETQVIMPSKEEAEIIIGKQRNGPTGTVKVIFNKELSRFEDISGTNEDNEMTIFVANDDDDGIETIII